MFRVGEKNDSPVNQDNKTEPQPRPLIITVLSLDQTEQKVSATSQHDLIFSSRLLFFFLFGN